MKNGNYVSRTYNNKTYTGQVNRHFSGVYAMNTTSDYIYFPMKIWSALPLASVE